MNYRHLFTLLAAAGLLAMCTSNDAGDSDKTVRDSVDTGIDCSITEIKDSPEA